MYFSIPEKFYDHPDEYVNDLIKGRFCEETKLAYKSIDDEIVDSLTKAVTKRQICDLLCKHDMVKKYTPA